MLIEYSHIVIPYSGLNKTFFLYYLAINKFRVTPSRSHSGTVNTVMNLSVR